MKPGDPIRDPRDAVIGLDAGDAVRPEAYGRRAADLARLTALGLPVPPGVALSFDCVAALADGGPMPVVPLPRPPLRAPRQPRRARLGRVERAARTSAPARPRSPR